MPLSIVLYLWFSFNPNNAAKWANINKDHTTEHALSLSLSLPTIK